MPAAARPSNIRRRSEAHDGFVGHGGVHLTRPSAAFIFADASARPWIGLREVVRARLVELVVGDVAVRLPVACECRRPARSWSSISATQRGLGLASVVVGAGRPPCAPSVDLRRGAPASRSGVSGLRRAVLLRLRDARQQGTDGGQCRSGGTAAALRSGPAVRPTSAVSASATGASSCSGRLDEQPYSSRWKPLNSGSCSRCSK